MRQGALIGPVIIAIGLVIAALTFAVVGALLETADGSAELRVMRAEDRLIDLRGELDKMSSRLRDVELEIGRLTEEQALLAAQNQVAARRGPAEVGSLAAPEAQEVDEIRDHGGTENMTEVMRLSKERFNLGISQPRNRVMLDVLGHPRSSYSQDCAPVTEPRLRSLLETRQIGPIRVTMIRPALDSLERVLTKLQETEPDIYAALGTAGGLCARFVRGSTRSVSNHSWGTAIDLKLEGKLDGFGDGGTQFGLLLLAELFNEEGWFWGATYSREDSMHFEVGSETLKRWQEEGKL